MAHFYDVWEEKWNKTQRDLNNPKIPLKYVIENGTLVWLPDGVETFTLNKLKKDPNRPVHKRNKIQSSR
jgi:type II site-specific deoxyribonuclease